MTNSRYGGTTPIVWCLAVMFFIAVAVCDCVVITTCIYSTPAFVFSLFVYNIIILHVFVNIQCTCRSMGKDTSYFIQVNKKFQNIKKGNTDCIKRTRDKTAAPDSCSAERPLRKPTYPRLVSTTATVLEKTCGQIHRRTDQHTDRLQ